MTVYDLDLPALSARLAEWGEPAFRARQVYEGLWRRAVRYDRMPNLPKALRERLAEELPLEVEVLLEREADRGGTRKALLRLGGSHVIETVVMGYRDRVTVCVSHPGGLRDGLRLLRHGTDGPVRQPDRRRDRRPGRLGEARRRATPASPRPGA